MSQFKPTYVETEDIKLDNDALLERRRIILKTVDIEKEIELAQQFLKNNSDLVNKYYDSLKFANRVYEDIILYITLKNSSIICKLFFQIMTLDVNYERDALFNNYDFAINYANFYGFAFMEKEIKTGEKDHNDWIIYDLDTTIKSLIHTCDICSEYIIVGDFACIVCHDFDICVNCKNTLSDESFKYQKFKFPDHTLDHELSQKYCGGLESNDYSHHLCFSKFTMDNLFGGKNTKGITAKI